MREFCKHLTITCCELGQTGSNTSLLVPKGSLWKLKRGKSMLLGTWPNLNLNTLPWMSRCPFFCFCLKKNASCHRLLLHSLNCVGGSHWAFPRTVPLGKSNSLGSIPVELELIQYKGNIISASHSKAELLLSLCEGMAFSRDILLGPSAQSPLIHWTDVYQAPTVYVVLCSLMELY